MMITRCDWAHNSIFQYYVYDVDSLIADIGGFLGLLIGQSLYGLYDGLTSRLKLKKMI